jgi:hypothetical protein
MKRPEWVACIKDARVHSNSSYCGKHLATLGFVFQDSDHAVLNGINGSRLVACKECVAVVVEGLRTGHDAY